MATSEPTASAGTPHAGKTKLDGFSIAVMLALTLAWGGNNVAIKIANSGLQPVFQSGFRLVLGSLLILIWCAFRRVRLFERDGTFAVGILVGTIFGVEFLLLYLGLDFTTAARGVVFFFSMPFFVAIGAHFMLPNERMTREHVIGLCVAFIGMVLAFSDKLSLPSPDALIGDVLCLIAGMLWAADTLIMKKSRLNQIAPEKSLLYHVVTGAILIMAAAPFFGPFIRDLNGLVIAAFAFQVIIVVGVTYGVWMWMIKHYPAARLASFAFLSPVYGVLLGALLLDEPVGVQLISALVLVAAGIFLVNRPRRDLVAPI